MKDLMMMKHLQNRVLLKESTPQDVIKLNTYTKTYATVEPGSAQYRKRSNLPTKTPIITAALFALCLPITLCAVQAGTLDTTFNPSGTPPGTVTTNPTSGIFDVARAVISQPDGKIIAVGFTPSLPDIVLVRYTVDGALDPSFGTGGIQLTPIGTAVQVNDAILQPDGKIVVTGNAIVAGVTKILVARYNTDGTLDNSFGAGGIQLTPIGPSATGDGIALQPDGKIVVAATTIPASFSVVRYNSDGTLDNSFGTGGITTTPVSGGNPNAMVLQPDGKIVVAGSAFVAGVTQFALARYNTDGSIDTSFGAGGFTFTPILGLSEATAVALQSDGKIVLGGKSQTSSPIFTLARYTTDGLLDTTFGASGIVPTTIGSASLVSGIVIQPDDKIIAAGGATTSPGNGDFALVRYRPNGALDVTFGSEGIVTTSIYNNDAINAIALAPNGKIVVAGYASTGPLTLFAVARYNGDPTSLRCSLALINKYGPRL